MPIRINLLAEAQAEEQFRRQDPVKRAIWLSAGVVAVVLAWVGTLYWQVASKQRELASVQQHWNRIKPRHDEIRRNDDLTSKTEAKIAQLKMYSTNRFLWAPVLNGLAQVSTNPFATNIFFLRLTAEQQFVDVPMVKAVTNAAGQTTVPARPPGTLERNRLMIDARDFSPDTDATYEKTRRAIMDLAFFKSVLNPASPVTLQGVSPGAPDPMQPQSRPFQSFVLQCQFAEKFR